MLACVCRPVSSALPNGPSFGGNAPQKRTAAHYHLQHHQQQHHPVANGGGAVVVTSEPRIATATIVKKKVPGRPSGAELRAMALRQQQQIDSQHQLLAAKEQRLRFLKAQEVRGAAAAAEGERLRRLRERVEAQESKLRRLRALRGQVDLQKTYNVTLGNDLDSIRALFSEKEKELSLAVAKVEALTRQLEDLRRDRRGPLNLIPGGGGAGGGGQAPNSPAALELDKLRRELMYRNQLSLQQDARLHLQREALQQRQAELRSVDQRILELQNRLHKKKASNVQLQHSQSSHILNSNLAIQLLGNSSILPLKPSNSVYPSQRNVPRGNVAAVEPYMHTPQKQPPKFAQSTNPSLKKPAQHQLIQDLTNLKHNLQYSGQSHINVNHVAESDESKLARQKLHIRQVSKDSADSMDSKQQSMPYKYGLSKSASSGSIPFHLTKSSSIKSNESDTEKAGVDSDSSASKPTATHQQLTVHSTPLSSANKSVAVPAAHHAHSTAYSSTPSATTYSPLAYTNSRDTEKPAIKPKAKHQIPSGNLVVPPRKPISSVAPTTITLVPKVVAHSPKVHMVAPTNIISTPIVSSVESDKLRPALPPKPASKHSPSDTEQSVSSTSSSAPTVVSVVNKPPMCEPSPQTSESSSPCTFATTSDHLPIKARPLTIKKQPLSEQPPKLRAASSSVGGGVAGAPKPMQYSSRRIEMPPAFMFPEIEKGNLKDGQPLNGNLVVDETDKSSVSTSNEDDIMVNNNKPAAQEILRRTRSNFENSNGVEKTKLARRVSFDPLALLLDASLEGELELVRKTTMQVPNPSAANDEGITALHNAICAGHLAIVKFLVGYGCDVNAQDSDGWTPLHCAASCNNLEMVKFLVESGACLFAATLSDHETPAEKCEEDEEGFDGCSEYLYSIQEKLGILNKGEVYAVFSYDSQQPDELSFDVNDQMTILRKGDDAEREWWWAKMECPGSVDSGRDGQEGYVPRNLLGLYPRVPLKQPLD